jgi:hypothetical protein
MLEKQETCSQTGHWMAGWRDRLERKAGGTGWRGRLEGQDREKG